MGRRDRYLGQANEFKEKDNYKPDFKLDYVDEKGRMMGQKEAFRYLSHKFHGKGPGKNKIDKRMKKMEQESVSDVHNNDECMHVLIGGLFAETEADEFD